MIKEWTRVDVEKDVIFGEVEYFRFSKLIEIESVGKFAVTGYIGSKYSHYAEIKKGDEVVYETDLYKIPDYISSPKDLILYAVDCYVKELNKNKLFSDELNSWSGFIKLDRG